ncbi:MAG: signal recognition particle-docking protein FtsY [Pantoea sp. Brub]|nr:signal recognition particle-docking protein FtsY [Pantoea sp. Brub]
MAEKKKNIFFSLFNKKKNKKNKECLQTTEQEIQNTNSKVNKIQTVSESMILNSIQNSSNKKDNLFMRFKRKLINTRKNLSFNIIKLFRGEAINDHILNKIEEQLLISDFGIETTKRIISKLDNLKHSPNAELYYNSLKEEMTNILQTVDISLQIQDKKPFVILIVGVNGVGKTSTIGKLAYQYKTIGKSVMIAAGDTFRAAAIEQLQIWSKYSDIPVIAQKIGADSAAVIFDAIQSAKARNIDILIIDTAGRLHNKLQLMDELTKITKVIKKIDNTAPHEIMLIIDASTGQNAINQAKIFHQYMNITGITITKLDGTAKGGIIFAIATKFHIPIRYISVGEKINDLKIFKTEEFISALFALDDIN